mgnify:CR=1 FL=1
MTAARWLATMRLTAMRLARGRPASRCRSAAREIVIGGFPRRGSVAGAALGAACFGAALATATSAGLRQRSPIA